MTCVDHYEIKPTYMRSLHNKKHTHKNIKKIKENKMNECIRTNELQQNGLMHLYNKEMASR